MTQNRQKLTQWLALNPNGFDSKTYEQIAKESDTNVPAVQRELPRLIAARDGIKPSDAKKRRHIAFKQRINRKRVYELYDAGEQVQDIAYELDCSEDAVRKILKKRDA